jgi:hypothetical protein
VTGVVYFQEEPVGVEEETRRNNKEEGKAEEGI